MRRSPILLLATFLAISALVGLAEQPATPAGQVQLVRSMECPPDMAGCTTASPRWHRNKFRQHVIRRGYRRIHYRAGLRNHILNVWHRKWRHRRQRTMSAFGGSPYPAWPGDREMWHRFTRHDTCSQNHYPANTVQHCRTRPPTAEDYARLEKVTFCGATVVVAIASGGNVWAIGGGAALCTWSFASNNV